MSPTLPSHLQPFVIANDIGVFWHTVKETGTPIVETLNGGHEFRLTFFACGSETTKSVIANGSGFDWKPTPLIQIPNTNIWFVQLEVPVGRHGSYYFVESTSSDITDESAQRRTVDPFNRGQSLDWSRHRTNSNAQILSHVFEVPGAPPLLYFDQPKKETQGERIVSLFKSSILRNSRELEIYRPNGFSSKQHYPILMVFDGGAYFNTVGVPTILDNMIAKGIIPPLVGLFPDSIDGPTRCRELPCNELFVRALTDEILPHAREQYGIKFGKESIVLAGSSYGGLAALFGAVTRPDIFTHVLSQAGAFYGMPGEDFSTGHSWVLKEIERTKVLPKKLYFDAGTNDKFFTSDGKHPTIIDINRTFQDQLLKMNYRNFRYNEYSGGHDFACWQRSFSAGLAWLLGR